MPKNAQLWSLQVNLTCDVLGERPFDVCGPSLSQNRLTRWSSYKRPPLTQFLKHPGRRLSARATRGFLARTERSTLRFVTGFQDCLRAHLSKMEKNDFHDSANTDQLLSVAAE
jgi:DNA (cytosine-5)-methyltransferase 1